MNHGCYIYTFWKKSTDFGPNWRDSLDSRRKDTSCTKEHLSGLNQRLEFLVSVCAALMITCVQHQRAAFHYYLIVSCVTAVSSKKCWAFLLWLCCVFSFAYIRVMSYNFDYKGGYISTRSFTLRDQRVFSSFLFFGRGLSRAKVEKKTHLQREL